MAERSEPQPGDEFYIGYEPTAPEALGKRTRSVVLLLLFIGAGLAFALVAAQAPFDRSSFEFGVERSFEGRVQLQPYPRLFIDRLGRAGSRFSSYLLVAPGKHGARDILADLDGQRVQLRGSLVYRQDQTMIEVIPGSVKTMEGRTSLHMSTGRSLGKYQLKGEIVDSKCFLGVMNPGEGKPHRACASLCIRGGIPPLLVVRDGSSPLPASYLLLVGEDGGPIGQEILDLVGEPVTLEGEVLEQDGVRTLWVNPAKIRPLA